MKFNNKITIIAATLASIGFTAQAQDATSSMETQDQSFTQAVVVSNVVMEKNGFVAIHATKDGNILAPDSIGHTYVTAGTHENVSVALTSPVENNLVIAMLHGDDGEMGVYEFGPDSTEFDTPVIVDGSPVVMPINITE